jgi:hypothetical protein
MDEMVEDEGTNEGMHDSVDDVSGIADPGSVGPGIADIADNELPTPVNSLEREERRSQQREDNVISRIENITYKVLRKHESGV